MIQPGAAAEVEELERLGWEALCGSGGGTYYAEIMADDGLMLFPGTIMDKATAVAAITDAPPWSRFELSDVRTLMVAPNTAVVVYRAEAARAGAAPYRALMSSVYARDGATWRLLFYQQTPAP